MSETIQEGGLAGGDATDRRLIALLKHDGRASVTTLAAELGLSRATVQKRIDRLIARGTIRRFTVDLDPASEQDLVRAIMLVAVDGKRELAVISRLRRMSEITRLHTTNGTWALVAEIETPNLPGFDAILREIGQIPGVTAAETCLLLTRVEG